MTAPRKRSREEAGLPSTPDSIATKKKTASLAPIFQPTSLAPSMTWRTLGNNSCLYGEHAQPPCNPKLAGFDLDRTIIEPKSGRKFSEGCEDWKFFDICIPSKLRALHANGYAIVFFSNQLTPKRHATNPKTIEAYQTEWKKKIGLIARALHDTPFRIFAATKRDVYRKPMPGMWYEIESMFKSCAIDIDKTSSFYVGDSAGRKGDFSSAASDRKFALNIGVDFYTPEEYFLDKPPAEYTLTGFHPSSLPVERPPFVPTSTPLVPAPRSDGKPHLVLYVGYPAMGKTALYNRHFEPAGYEHINQDTLKTKAKCLNAVEAALKAGRSVVVDNTNRNRKTREDYLDLAEKYGVECRCVLFDGTYELAWHNNLYRAFCLSESVKTNEEPRKLVEGLAFTSFRSAYEAPTMDEGFKEIKTVFWKFEGGEEDVRRYGMWLSID